MRLPNPTPGYDPKDQRDVRKALTDADQQNLKRDQAITEEPIVRTSPDGSQWLLGVSNAGVTTWTAYP